MRKTKMEKGITLIALIITIVILLILAVVAINSITNDKVVDKTKNAASEYEIMEEKTKLQKEVLEWQVIDAGNMQTLEEYLGDIYGKENVKPNTDETLNVTVPSGNTYKVKEDGTIIPVKGISIVGTGMPLVLNEGKTVTGTLTATLVGISGEISWSNANSEVATISETKGASVTVTAVSKGETKVTASCGSYSAIYTVQVKESLIVPVGSYVAYDVSYTDMYQGTEYTSTNGWRYLGTDDDGNKLIISTAIPMVLFYKSNDSSAKWWDADTTLNVTVRATNGMLNNLDKIPYTQTMLGTNVLTANTAIGRFADKDGMIGDYFKSTTYWEKIVKVRTLTLAELNKATNSATGGNRTETYAGQGFKDLTKNALGLFDMQKLDGYSASYSYWLASPRGGSTIPAVKSDIANIPSCDISKLGLRPVVVLSSDIEMEDTNGDGVYEIQQK